MSTEQGISPTQELLIRGLRLFECQADTALGIMLMMDTEDRQWALMDWMVENRNATEVEVFQKAVEIWDATEPEDSPNRVFKD